MRSIEGIIPGDLRVDEPCDVTAIVNGSIQVGSKGDLHLKGICNGRVNVNPGGKVTLTGIANGGIHYAVNPIDSPLPQE